MRLVPNWKKAHRMLSVQLTALNGSIAYGWALVPDTLRTEVPHAVVVGVSIALFALPVIGRLIDQGGITDPPMEPKE